MKRRFVFLLLSPVVAMAQAAGTFTATGSMTTPRFYHTATRRPCHALAIALRSPNTLYLATSGSGIFKSSDGRAHSTPFNENLINLDVRVLAVAPSGLNRLYAATPGGAFTIVDEPVQAVRPQR